MMSDKRDRRARFVRKIWIFNLAGILFILSCFFWLNSEEEESGLLYKQLLFDEEISQYRGMIPDSLLGLYVRNPETEEFVLNYPSYKNLAFEIDLSDELSGEGIPLFLQWDKRWGYEQYGDDFMAINGCGPTCLSMVICGLTKNTAWHPLAVAEFAYKEGFYAENSGTSWSLMTEGAKMLDLTVHEVIFDDMHIREALAEGRPVICTMGPGDFTTSGHYIVLTGLAEDGRVVVRDPNSMERSEMLWEMETLMKQIKNLWGYSYKE